LDVRERVRGAANAALARISAVLRGPWRVTVAEASMLPAIAPGDWLLVDPTVRRWPRRGSIVVFREPETGALAVKRIAGLGGDRIPFAGGYLVLAADEAWLEADASAETAKAAGFGSPIDSHRFGPVPLELLVGRVWFRYGPVGRIGRIGRSSAASAEHPPDA
jgi:signal peptidase I